MRPIRRDLLIHTIEYIEVERDEWDKTSSNPIKVSRVRIEPSKHLISRGTDDTIQSSGSVLFWDVVHSSPCNFRLGDIVRFNGRDMTIVDIKELYDRDKLHHLEVQVI